MASSESNMASQNEIVLGENEMVCSLTNSRRVFFLVLFLLIAQKKNEQVT